jgi:hypothetical protein
MVLKIIINAKTLMNMSPMLIMLYPTSTISVNNLYFVSELPKACISFTLLNTPGLMYPVKYDKVGKTGILPLLDDIAKLLSKLPAIINTEPIKALTY